MPTDRAGGLGVIGAALFAGEVAASWVAVEVSLRRRGLSATLDHRCRASRRRSDHDEPRSAAAVVLRVRRVCDAVRARNCLRRAIVAKRMLDRRGIVTEVRIGSRLTGGAFAAHAWLEYRGQPVVAADALDYSPFILPDHEAQR